MVCHISYPSIDFKSSNSCETTDKEDVRVSPFWHLYDVSHGDYFSAVVSTNPIFQGLPVLGKVVAPKMSRAEFTHE
ncbi:hypothetical protein J3R83DRAFT_9043 [Lanmaoa asiatica]|nr:hypothetical protein J3R83DRAFT_9043 [Lanmaoa asiatica]